jgi:hypothetical protein
MCKDSKQECIQCKAMEETSDLKAADVKYTKRRRLRAQPLGRYAKTCSISHGSKQNIMQKQLNQQRSFLINQGRQRNLQQGSTHKSTPSQGTSEADIDKHRRTKKSMPLCDKKSLAEPCKVHLQKSTTRRNHTNLQGTCWEAAAPEPLPHTLTCIRTHCCPKGHQTP